jgi:hypothetical protein
MLPPSSEEGAASTPMSVDPPITSISSATRRGALLVPPRTTCLGARGSATAREAGLTMYEADSMRQVVKIFRGDTFPVLA